MRKVTFSENEFYHIYNRGVDKRIIFSDETDIGRFFESMSFFNTTDTMGSLRDKHHPTKNLRSPAPETKLVEFTAYCLNPNHYHFILRQVAEKGIEKFMHKLGTGYTNYFNIKNKRTGSLFQGRFKAIHIDSNEYLLHLSAYVNLNNLVHKLENSTLVKIRSSFGEYVGTNTNSICEKDIVLSQFSNKEEYCKFANNALENILERKDELKEISNYLLEQ